MINGKKFLDKHIASDIKRYKKIRTLTTEQVEDDYNLRCLLDYEYIKIHYRQIAVNLNRQKELHAIHKQLSK